jgi:gamma-glutamyl-gamma-aminobutyrate hydrolase PuuD
LQRQAIHFSNGLILSGGGDVSACLYGKPPHPQAETLDLWRDVWERYLALLSRLLCLPTLGICRGMQLMNAALGGTIYQDLPTEWPKDRPALLRHRGRGWVFSSNWITHPVELVRPDSRLALAVKGRGELGRPVLSMHHQAVEMGEPFTPTMCAANGNWHPPSGAWMQQVCWWRELAAGIGDKQLDVCISGKGAE